MVRSAGLRSRLSTRRVLGHERELPGCSRYLEEQPNSSLIGLQQGKPLEPDIRTWHLPLYQHELSHAAVAGFLGACASASSPQHGRPPPPFPPIHMRFPLGSVPLMR